MPGKACCIWRMDLCVATGFTHPVVVVALVGMWCVRVNGRKATAFQNVSVPQETIGNISIELVPLINSLTFFEMIIVNVIESLVPSLAPLFVQLYDLLTKPTPEPRLPVSPDLMSFELLANVIFVANFMPILEVSLELLSPVKDLGTLLDSIGARLMTPPCFDLTMLRIFVSFPVVLTAKGLETTFESAAIRTSMTLLMLSATHP